MDSIELDYKNQAVKILEKYYWASRNIQQYESVIVKEIDEYEELTNFETLKQELSPLLAYIRYFVVQIHQVELLNRPFFEAMCKLNGFVDKILAISLADVFDMKQEFVSENEFQNLWLDSLEQSKSKKEQNPGDMDLSGLKIGMTVKNYKVLCEILEQPIKDGKSRKLQLKDFKRYFDWEKSGQKFIITDIYDTPLTKEDKRKFGNNSIYVKYIEVILLKYLSKQKECTKTFTKRNWWGLLGIVNEKYDRVSTKKLEDLDYTVTSWEVKHFYQRCNKKLEEILFSALNSLKSRKLITYEIQTIIVKYDDKNGEKYSEANDNEKKMLLDVEHHVLHNIFKYDKMIQVFLRFQQKEFYEKVNELLYERYGWDHCFKQIKIIYTPDGVRQVYPELEAKLQKEISLMLNEEVCNAIDQNAKDIYSKQLKAHKEWEESCWANILNNEGKVISRKKEPFCLQHTYLDAQSILTDELIKIGHKNMVFSSKEFLESNEEVDSLFDFSR